MNIKKSENESESLGTQVPAVYNKDNNWLSSVRSWRLAFDSMHS